MLQTNKFEDSFNWHVNFLRKKLVSRGYRIAKIDPIMRAGTTTIEYFFPIINFLKWVLFFQSRLLFSSSLGRRLQVSTSFCLILLRTMQDRTGRTGRTGQTGRAGRTGRTGATGQTGRAGRRGRTGRTRRDRMDRQDRMDRMGQDGQGGQG